MSRPMAALPRRGIRPMPFEDWIETRYEAKARREGRASAYLTLPRGPRE